MCLASGSLHLPDSRCQPCSQACSTQCMTRNVNNRGSRFIGSSVLPALTKRFPLQLLILHWRRQPCVVHNVLCACLRPHGLRHANNKGGLTAGVWVEVYLNEQVAGVAAHALPAGKASAAGRRIHIIVSHVVAISAIDCTNKIQLQRAAAFRCSLRQLASDTVGIGPPVRLELHGASARRTVTPELDQIASSCSCSSH
jgi:hypothetical protein